MPEVLDGQTDESEARTAGGLEFRAAERENELRVAMLDMPAMSPRIEVGREPLTYEPHGDRRHRSYVRDRWMAEQHGDFEARERLNRHAAEMRVIYEARDRRAMQARDGLYEVRVAPSWTPGNGGYFAPPMWLVEHFATEPRPERVISRLAPNFELPEGPQSLHVPRLTTGALTTTPQLDSPAGDRSPLDADASSQVVTIAGNADVPIQMIEQSPLGAPFDWVMFTDLRSSYENRIETQILMGTGAANGQLAGIIPATPTVVYNDASPTATEMFPFIGQTLAQLSIVRRLPPQAWMMTTSRFAWLGTSEDNSNRPLLLSDYLGTFPIASLAAFPVYLNESISREINNAGQDVLIAFRYDDLMVFESGPRMQYMPDVLSGTLQVRLQLRGYVAVINRYPSGVATLGGTGMTIQPGF